MRKYLIFLVFLFFPFSAFASSFFIVAWNGTSSIPSGFQDCDGSNGTPDLSTHSRYLVNPGDAGSEEGDMSIGYPDGIGTVSGVANFNTQVNDTHYDQLALQVGHFVADDGHVHRIDWDSTTLPRSYLVRWVCGLAFSSSSSTVVVDSSNQIQENLYHGFVFFFTSFFLVIYLFKMRR